MRSLKRSPIFAISVIVTLVLGVASVGSIFAIVYSVLLAPLPYGEPDRLVSISLQSVDQRQILQPTAVYFTYRQNAQRLDDIAVYRTGNANLWTEGDGDDAERVTATWVSASMMPILQIAPLLGRSFKAEEELRGGPEAVVLSESIWRTRFNSAPDILGKTLMINSVSREVVGVMPPEFSFPTADTRLWLPVKHSDNATVGDFAYSAVARLSAGATVEQLQRELGDVLPSMAMSFPRLDSGSSTATWLDEAKPTPVVLSLHDEVTSGIGRTLWTLAAAAALVLLVACANVVNLMLIRADVRQREFAVRAALGASRLTLTSHVIVEALLLGAVAGFLALLLTVAAVNALVAFGPVDVPRLAELRVGLPIAGFIGLVSCAGAIICAAVAAAWTRSANLSSRLKDGGRGESAGKSRQRLRASIVVFQIALAFVVSVGSVLLLRTAHNLQDVQPGFDAAGVTSVWTQLPFARYDDARSVAFYTELTARVSELPSVTSAGLTTRVPLGVGRTLEQTFRSDETEQTLTLPVNVVDAGYFDAIRIPLLAGRSFRPLALEGGGDVVISQRAAISLFGESNSLAAIGKRLTLAPSGLSYNVIGIVGDVREQDLTMAPTSMIYRPQVAPTDPSAEPGAQRTLALMVRTNGPTDSLLPAIRQIVRDLDPTVPIFKVETMNEVMRASTARLSLMLTLMTMAAVITLLLGAIGLYGAIAYLVAQQTRAFGVRVALGAAPRDITRWVATRGIALTVSGIAVGLALYLVAAPLLRGFLFGVTATDPAALVGATLLLVSTAAIASWFPAVRAARADPIETLRAE